MGICNKCGELIPEFKKDMKCPKCGSEDIRWI